MADINRAGRALRGLAVAVVIVVGFTLTLVAVSGGFDDQPTVTATMDVAGSPLTPNAPVQYLGVQVGTLAAVTQLGGQRSALVLRIDAGQLGRIPASVRVRVLPRTIFGDQYIDLATPAPPTGGFLTAGAAIAPDTSTATVDLYHAYQQAYTLLSKIQPAQLNQVLTALADTLNGRGAEIGRLIDKLYSISGTLAPAVAQIGPLLRTFGNLAGNLRAAAPDLLTTMNNAVSLSRFVAARQDSIAALLSSGTQAAAATNQLLTANASNIITVLHTADPVLSTFAAQPDGMSDILQAFASVGANTTGLGNRSTLRINSFDLSGLAPYTSADCPRYPGLAGPNCSIPPPQPATPSAPAAQQNGAQNPLPSSTGQDTGQQENAKIRSVLPQITGSGQQPPPGSNAILDMLLGPLLRGKVLVLP
jgi:virulence factor Mce-like protein